MNTISLLVSLLLSVQILSFNSQAAAAQSDKQAQDPSAPCPVSLVIQVSERAICAGEYFPDIGLWSVPSDLSTITLPDGPKLPINRYLLDNNAQISGLLLESQGPFEFAGTRIIPIPVKGPVTDANRYYYYVLLYPDLHLRKAQVERAYAPSLPGGRIKIMEGVVEFDRNGQIIMIASGRISETIKQLKGIVSGELDYGCSDYHGEEFYPNGQPEFSELCSLGKAEVLNIFGVPFKAKIGSWNLKHTVTFYASGALKSIRLGSLRSIMLQNKEVKLTWGVDDKGGDPIEFELNEANTELTFLSEGGFSLIDQKGQSVGLPKIKDYYAITVNASQRLVASKVFKRHR